MLLAGYNHNYLPLQRTVGYITCHMYFLFPANNRIAAYKSFIHAHKAKERCKLAAGETIVGVAFARCTACSAF